MSAAINVLLVDANPATRASLSAFLRSYGFAVKQAGTTLDAFAAVIDCVPDAVIIDIGIASADGVKVAEALAERTRPPLLIAVLGTSTSAAPGRPGLFGATFGRAGNPLDLVERVMRHMARKTVDYGGQ